MWNQISKITIQILVLSIQFLKYEINRQRIKSGRVAWLLYWKPYIIYSYNTLNCTHYFQQEVNLLHFAGNLIRNWFYVMEIDLTCVKKKFELASWKFGFTLCEPDLTIREFELISWEFDLTIYEFIQTQIWSDHWRIWIGNGVVYLVFFMWVAPR